MKWLLLLVIPVCVGFYYVSRVLAEFNSEDAKERPWAYDHKAAMGAGCRFFIVVAISFVLTLIVVLLV